MLSIDILIKKTKKQVLLYEKMPDYKKLSNIESIKKKINSCKKTVNEYMNMIDEPELYKISDESHDNQDDNQNNKKNTDNEDQFKKYIKKIEEIKKVIESDKDGTNIEDMISNYIQLTEYIEWCKEYLEKKKEINVEHV